MRTPDDFGHLGEPPVHGPLLDHLAGRFVEEGWSTKKLVREIVRSATWRQASAARPENLAVDPGNRLWHHYPRRRLEAEAIRDSMLAVSGRLDRTLGGPSVDPHRAKEDPAKRLVSGPVDGHGRRSIYVKMTLMEPPRFLAVFNQPLPRVTEWKRDDRSQAAGHNRKWLGSLWPFSRRGASGLWVSDLFPHQAAIADDLCVVRSLVGESPLHGAQNLLLHTGRSIGAAPSIGAWINYGLGTENDNLPGYVLLNNDWVPNGGFQNFASGFLPATCQATTLRAKGPPVDNILAADPPEVQRVKLAFLREQGLAAAAPADARAIEAAIRTFETAARMQTTIPDVCDVAGETEATRRLYGLDRGTDHERFYALQCLRARAPTAATTMSPATPCGSPAAASAGAWPTARPTRWGWRRWSIRSISTTSTRRSCTAWGSTTPG